MFDPEDHIPDPVHGMDGYDYVVCSCGWASSDPKARGWLDHLPDSLDSAWAEAEAALPEGWELIGLDGIPEQENGAQWEAKSSGPRSDIDATGLTPAAALRALAAQLRKR